MWTKILMVFADIRSFVALAGVGSPSARASFSVSVSSSEVHCRWGMCSHCWRVPHTQGDCTLLVPGKTWEGLDGTTYEYFATCPVIDQVNTLLSVPGQAVRAVAQRQVRAGAHWARKLVLAQLLAVARSKRKNENED